MNQIDLIAKENRSAEFSPCRKYRYTLLITWEAAKPILNVIGLNPSTADEVSDDNTIRRCKDFAKQWGFGALCMTNIFAYRATDPNVMKANEFPIGVLGDFWLREISRRAGLVVAAWGTHGAHLERGQQVQQLLTERGVKIHCLGRNADGSPKHPLYLPKSVKPELL